MVQPVTKSGTTYENEWYNERQRVVQRVTGLDKFIPRRAIFRARNFTCAPDWARKKWDV